MRKIDKNYYILILLSLVLVFVTLPVGCLFGSLVDWFPQHIMFPEYFRNLFYETGDLFPDLALALGAGQNIYHFSYYGLLSPIILFSYFFPFISMTNYLMFAYIVLYVATNLLTYKWMKCHFSKKISLCVSILILCASPLLFHFHRHVMFVSYMPFLILGLMGVEKFFEKKQGYLIVVSVFLIIMTSYYYSIPSLLVLVLYGIYQYIHTVEKINISSFFKIGFSFLVPIFLGVMLSCVLLVPTFLSIFNGRQISKGNSFWSYFVPSVNFDSILYSNYSMGLTAVAVLALLYGFFHRNKENRFLSITCFILLIFPIFSYVLNGFLYVREKVWIPFLPLFGLLIGFLLKDLEDKKLGKNFFLYIPILLICLFFAGYRCFWFYMDSIFVYVLFYLYLKKTRKGKYYFIGFIVPLMLVFGINVSDKYVSNTLYKDSIHSSTEIQNILRKEKDLVRVAHLNESLYNANKIYGSKYYTDSLYSSVYNSDYKRFYTNVFRNPLSYRNTLITVSNNNLLYQMFMGDRYIYSQYGMLGYRKVSDFVYKNEDVLPVIYATTHLISETEFAKMSYPETVETLLKNAVVKGKGKNLVNTTVTPKKVSYHTKLSNDLDIKAEAKSYQIKASKGNKLVLELNEKVENKILLIDFKVGREWNCKKGDAWISINHTKNTLTCKQWRYKNENKRFHYILSDQKLKELVIHFAPGEYNISDVHAYEIDYSAINHINQNIIPFKINSNKTKGDKIEGTIHLHEDGYFITSIPYDKGFRLKDNGKKINYEKVNTAFLGFPLKKGNHDIKIEYHAPGVLLGKVLSLLGIVGTLVYFIIQRKAGSEKYYSFLL